MQREKKSTTEAEGWEEGGPAHPGFFSPSQCTKMPRSLAERQFRGAWITNTNWEDGKIAVFFLCWSFQKTASPGESNQVKFKTLMQLITFWACSMLSQSVARCFHLLHPARHINVLRAVMQCRPTELSIVMATFHICAVYISGQSLATCGYWALAMWLVQLKKEFLFQLI